MRIFSKVYSNAARDDWRTISDKAVARLTRIHNVPSPDAKRYVKSQTKFIQGEIQKYLSDEWDYWGDGETTKKIQRDGIARTTDAVSRYMEQVLCR